MAPRRPVIVVLGMAAKMAVAGAVWQTIHYLLGFERLGYDVYYVEAHARTPTMLMREPDDDSSAIAATFLSQVMGRFGFGNRWAFHALHDDGRVFGMSESQLERLYRSADLIINLHGGTEPRPEHVASDRLVFLETDPVMVQIELFKGDQRAIEYLEPHQAFFTFGENYGNPGCLLPVSDRFQFRKTRQPVVLELWEREGPLPESDFRTIGNWKQLSLEVEFMGEVYSWSKHYEFLKFLDLPLRTEQGLELALAKIDDEDRALLVGHGWKLRDALSFSQDLDAYRDYVHGARGEFSVAKDQNVRLRSGWFSDRSATFLACGRPVVVQDTAFDCVLPIGEGLFAFKTAEEAVEALERINADPERHRQAARNIAREYFSHEVVLGRLLGELGLPVRPGVALSVARTVADFPVNLATEPISRHPTELDPATVETVLARPVPRLPGHLRSIGAGGSLASVIVVTRDGLPFTRMCLESVLVATSAPYEVIVVDNASSEETLAYLSELRALNPQVRVVFNGQNAGFAPAVNQGLELASGDLLVILNNDTIVPRGWLDGLAAHVDDSGVGLIGPVTNDAGNEARIDVPYRTYGELLEFARRRAELHAGEAFDISVLTMFCVAMRRDVYEQIGQLDERYTIGMFEDDDYSLRLREAGYRLLCAEDVFVHHFGMGSFGSLVPTGEYSSLFEANRKRFEAKWGREWETHSQRPSDSWELLVQAVRELVHEAVPQGATLLVVNRGDDALLDLGGREGWHFPRDETGGYAGYYPADSAEAIEQIERQRGLGAEYMVFPTMELWWLDHYDGLRKHLERGYGEFRRGAAGVIYSLQERPGARRARDG